MTIVVRLNKLIELNLKFLQALDPFGDNYKDLKNTGKWLQLREHKVGFGGPKKGIDVLLSCQNGNLKT